jgi:hypothetical protein
VYSALVLLLATHSADAGWVLFHQQGKAGHREAWYAEVTAVRDRTEVESMLGTGADGMAKTSVRELPVIVVYESAAAPEWDDLKVQFECVNKYRTLSYAEASRANELARREGRKFSSSVIVDGWNDPKKWNEPVKMRLGPRSYSVPRVDLSNRPLAATRWSTDGSAPMIKAQKFACQDEDVRKATEAANTNSQFNAQTFSAGLQQLGLTEPVHALDSKTVIDLLNLSWNVLWQGSQRADPSGFWVKKPSPEEQARYEAQYAAIQKQMKVQTDAAQVQMQPHIERHQEEQAFLEIVQRVRGNRQVGEEERLLLSLWQGRPQEQVGVSMGAAKISETSGLRYLSYESSFDNRSALVSAVSGRVISTQGASGSCRIDFVTALDRKGVLRVADIRISSQGEVGGGVCRSLWRLPENVP